MAGKTGRKSLLGGLISIEQDASAPAASPEVVRERDPAPQPQTPDRPPMTLNALIPGGGALVAPSKRTAATVSPSSSSKVAELVAEVQKHVPAGNATLQLMTAMDSLKDVLSDPNMRRDAALKVLATQGVTAESVAAGQKEVEAAIDRCLDGLIQSADAVRARDVDGKRSEAQTLRGQIDGKRREIDAINSTIAGLEREAAALDEQAQAREGELQQFRTDVETARIAARTTYGV